MKDQRIMTETSPIAQATNPAEISTRDDDRLVWLDMEMTGLNPLSDRIIELAIVITDKNLNTIAEAPVWVIHQADEVLNGIFRLRYLVRLLGKQTAQAVSVLTGLSLAAAVCIYFAPHWQLRSESGLWAMGVALSAFMAAFDVAVGRWLMRRSWGQITADFDPRGGNNQSGFCSALSCTWTGRPC